MMPSAGEIGADGNDEDGLLAVSILASLLPPPSQFALMHDVPGAVRSVLAAQRQGQSAGPESLPLLVEGFAALKEFLLDLSPEDVERREHENPLEALILLLQDIEVRSEVRDIISVEELVEFLGLTTRSDLVLENPGEKGEGGKKAKLAQSAIRDKEKRRRTSNATERGIPGFSESAANFGVDVHSKKGGNGSGRCGDDDNNDRKKANAMEDDEDDYGYDNEDDEDYKKVEKDTPQKPRRDSVNVERITGTEESLNGKKTSVGLGQVMSPGPRSPAKQEVETMSMGGTPKQQRQSLSFLASPPMTPGSRHRLSFAPAEGDIQPIWVATQIFKAIRCLLSTRPCAERDLELERIMKRYIRAMPLPMIREFTIGQLEQFCRNLSSLDNRAGLRQCAALVFIKSPVLQRRLDSVDLILDMDVSPQWLTSYRILDSLLEKTPVHPELCRRAEPIVRHLAKENLISDSTLKLIWSVNLHLLCVAAQEVPDMTKLDNIIKMVTDNSSRTLEIVKLVRTIAVRTDLNLSLAESCILRLWDLRDAEGVATALLSSMQNEDGLLDVAIDLCMKTLDQDASFFAHQVLDLLWRHIPALGDILDSDWALEDRWFDAVSVCLNALDQMSSEPELQNALDLGTQLLLHESSTENPQEIQAALMLRIWDVFMPHLGEDSNVRASVTETYFTWLSNLCETKILYPEAAHVLFVERAIPFVQAAQDEMVKFVFGPACFSFIRSIFVLDNHERLVNMKDNNTSASAAPGMSLTSADYDGLEDPLAYVVPTCDPGELEGVHLLWQMAVHTWSDPVAESAVSALQALYDPSLDPENKNALRVRRDYVAKCTTLLENLPEDATDAMQRCLGFVEALLNEADQHGTRGFRSHGARQRGQIHNLVLIADHEGDFNGYNIMEEPVYEVTLYSNATVWDIRCAVASRLQNPIPAAKIALTWPSGGDVVQLGPEENSTTLADLGFHKAENLKFQFQDDEAMLQRTPRVRLLDENSNELTPLARSAFEGIFEDWASDQIRNLLNLEDFTQLFTFCTGATNHNAIERRCASAMREYASVYLPLVSDEDESPASLAAAKTANDIKQLGSQSSILESLPPGTVVMTGTSGEDEFYEPFLTVEDFLRFYKDASQSRPLSVWKDLLKLGYDTKLQRSEAERPGGRLTSEFRLSWFDQMDEEDDDDNSVAPESRPEVGWRPILAHEAPLYRVLFRMLKCPAKTVSRTAWSILLRLPTSDSVLAALQNIEAAKLPSFLSINEAGVRFVQYALHVIVSFMEADESREIIGAAGGTRTGRGSVEQHFERARRASFEPKRSDQLNDNSKNQPLASSSSPSEAPPSGEQWTNVFLQHRGLIFLQDLVQNALEQVAAEGGSSLDATPMGQVLELSLKAIKLSLICTKFGSVAVLSSMEFGEQMALVERSRCVINAILGAQIQSMLSAEYALFIWDFYFSWLSKQPSHISSPRIAEAQCVELQAAHKWKDISLNEVSFTRQVWHGELVQSLHRMGTRFPVMRDRYIEILCRIQVQDGLRGWLQELAAKLLTIKPPNKYMPSSSEFDMRFVNSLVKSICAGMLNLCTLLAEIVREDYKSIDALSRAEFTVQELVIQLAHRLTSARGGEHRGPILELLAALSECDESVASLVGETLLLPLLRSKDPTMTKKTNRRQSLERRNYRVGLVNLHNTCYMNCFLQQLALMAPVRDLVFAASGDADESTWLGSLQLVLAYLLRSERKAFSPVQLVNALNINPREQQDCEEFMNRLFELLEDATNNTERWDSAFGGKMQVKRTCQACKSNNTVVESVGTHIAVDVEGSNSVGESMTRSVFYEETLEGFRCENCGEVGHVSQQKAWDTVPQTLILHLKRFRFDLGLGVKEKLNNTFYFDEELYGRELVGIICHQGAAEGGHYYSYIRSRPDEEADAAWYELNDVNVRTLDGFPSEAFQSAYILCYMDKSYLTAPPPMIPRAIQSKIDRDNLSLESSCTVKHPQFWQLCDVVMDQLWKISSSAVLNTSPEPVEAGFSTLTISSPRMQEIRAPSESFESVSVASRSPDRIKDYFSDRSSPQSITTPEQRARRRSSASSDSPLVPSWWPQSARATTLTPKQPQRKILLSSPASSASASPATPERRTLPLARNSMTETLALSLLRMLSIESIFKVDRSVMVDLHDAILGLCAKRQDFMVQVAQTLMTLCASYPLVAMSFSFTERFLQQAFDHDVVYLVHSILLRSESFLEALVASYEKGDMGSRKSVCRCFMLLIRATAVDVSAPMYSSACEAFDWVLSSDPGFARVFLRTCEGLVTSVEEFACLSRDFSSLSSTCADVTTAALLEGLDRDEDDLIKTALRVSLALNDQYCKSRMTALLAARNAPNWSQHLQKILALLESQVGQDMRLHCLGSPAGLLFCCTNTGPEIMKVQLWFPLSSSHQIYRLADPDTALAIEIPPSETRLVYYAERLLTSSAPISGEAVSPSRSGLVRCEFEWDSQPVQRPVAQPKQLLLSQLHQARKSAATSPSARGFDDQENCLRVNVDDEDEDVDDGHCVNKMSPGPSFDDDAQLIAQMQTLASMGFGDQTAVRAALKAARGNEQVAIEFLLASSSPTTF